MDKIRMKMIAQDIWTKQSCQDKSSGLGVIPPATGQELAESSNLSIYIYIYML